MSYLQHFPDFDYPLPKVEGFADNTWHDDVCPSLSKRIGVDRYLVIYCDYKNPSMREWEGTPQFALCQLDGSDSDSSTIHYLDTDSWEEIISKIRELGELK